jgi:putative ABC transport system substrate-binding protein
MPADPGAPVRRLFIANGVASAVLAAAPALAETLRKTPRVGMLYLRSQGPSDGLERPSKLDLTVNRKVARSLGIAIPQSILLRADRVIE